MKNQKLLMPLAFAFCVLTAVSSYAANQVSFTESGVPFTAKYLRQHHFVSKKGNFYQNGVFMAFYRTQSGLYDDWTITVSNDNYSCTLNTTNSDHGYLATNEELTHYFYGKNTDGFYIPPGIYNVTLQCNNSNAYRTDITVTGDNNTYGGIWDTNPYNNPFTVTGIEVTNGGYGIDIGTSTNY